MLKAYQYRLYPTPEQETMFAKHFGCVRWIYNWGLERKTKAWTAEKKSITRTQLQTELVKNLKPAEETKWLKEVNSQSLLSSIMHLDMAFNGFFRKRTDYPKFKSRLSRQSFHCPQHTTVDFKSGTIDLPKIDGIKTVFSQTFEGQIKTSTISKSKSGRYFISILVDDGKELPKPAEFSESTTVGVDLGLTHFATLSTGEKIENPRPLRKNLDKLARLQRIHCRRKKDSKNREHARNLVARLHERISNIRKDFLHKLSTKLIRENQAVAVEDLNVKGMLSNHRVALSISDVGWSSFLEMLKYKASWYGSTILKIGRFEPSSRLCTCGTINRSLELKDRTWTCSSCGLTHDRDILAAGNIKRMALHPNNFIGRGTPEFTPVET